MARYCPSKVILSKAALRACALFLFALLAVLMPINAYAQAPQLHEPCGPGFGRCGTGLSCYRGECLGGNGYITDNPDSCSPELDWRGNRCLIDITSHGEQLGVGDTTTDIRDNIRTFINILLGFLGVIAVIVIIYAGFTWMTSLGNAERVTKAKRTIIWAVVGIIVILSAWTIASYIINLGQNLTGVSPGGGGGSGGGGGGGVPPNPGVVE